MSSLLIFHTDLDGIGVGVLQEYFNLPFDKVLSCDYGFEADTAILEFMNNADEIVFADISIPENLYNSLIQKGKKIFIFDHHETSKWTQDKENCVWDDKRSGTKIFFDEYIKKLHSRYKPIVQEFVNLVDIYDRWDLKSPLREMSEDLQRVFVNMGEWNIKDAIVRHARFTRLMVRKFDKENNFNWGVVEKYHIKLARASEEKAYKSAVDILQIRKDNRGRKFAVFYAWGKISMTCHKFLNIDNLDVDYIICAQTFHNEWGVLSLRSREGQFDLLQLAGVNGHKAAAGAELTSDDAHRLIDENMCFKYKDEIKNENDAIIEMCKE